MVNSSPRQTPQEASVGHRAGRGPLEVILFAAALLVLGIVALSIFVIPSITKAQSCVSPLALGTVVSGDQNGRTVSVPLGSIVTLSLGGAYNVSSTVYPRSSDPKILRQMPLCKEPQLVSSYPGSTTSFKAVRPGRALVSLYPRDSALSLGPPASPIFQASVIVTRFDVQPWLALAGLIAVAATLVYLYRRPTIRSH
jgi:hypothetical protein